jgi:hypothetical protein
MVMAEFEHGSDVLADSAELLAHALPDRLPGLMHCRRLPEAGVEIVPEG